MKTVLNNVRNFAIRSVGVLGLFAISATAATDVWTGGGAPDGNWTNTANWGLIAPNPYDSLIFAGTTQLLATNNYPAGTAFDGINFSNTAGSFALNGNNLLLSGQVMGATNNIINNSGSPQVINANLNLDWGYYTIYGPGSTLSLNGNLIPNLGGIADFGSANVQSTSFTTDGTGLISGLGGAGLIGNNGASSGGGFSGLATVSGGAVVPYSYSGNQVIGTAGPIGVDATTALTTGFSVETTNLSPGFAFSSTALTTGFAKSVVVSSVVVANPVGIIVGETFGGTGVPAGVTVSSIAGSTINVASFTSTAASAGNYSFTMPVNSVVVAGAAGISIGQVFSGTGVPTNVTVTGVSGNTVNVAMFTPTAVSGGNYNFGSVVSSVGVTSTAGIQVGAPFAGTGVPNGVTVASISGNTVNLNPFTATASSAGNYTFGSLASDPANIEITASTGNFSLAGGTSTAFGTNQTFINTALLTVSGTTKITTLLVPGGNGTLVLGTTNAGTGMYVGGIYLPGGQTVQELTVGSGGSTFLTAGPMTAGTPVPGEIIIGVNGNNTGNEAEMNAVIKDNLSGGPVSVVYTGGGSLYVNNTGNSYSGGTYINLGRVQANSTTAFGTGPVHVAGGDAELSLQNVGTGTMTNNFFISPASSYVGAATEGAMRLDGTGNAILIGQITLMGSPVGTLPASPAGADAVADRISGQSADTTTFAGQITGTGTLEFYAGASGITFVLSNKTATANNWTGGLIVDGVANDTSDLRILANNQLGGNNVTLIQAGTAFARLDLNGFNDTIGGLTGTGSPLNQVTDLGSAASSLTLGAGNATATFGGVIGGDTAPNSLSLVKTGSGTQTLTGANNYTGSTTVNGGDLVFNPGAFSAKTPLVTVNSNAVLDVSAAGALALNQGLSMSNGTMVVALQSGVTTVTATTLTANGPTNYITITAVPPIGSYPAQISVIKYSGLAGALNFGLAGSLPLSPGTPYAGYISNNVANNSVDLVITAGPPDFRWVGYSSGSINTAWDTSTPNWLTFANLDSTYSDGDFVQFDDSASNGVVTLSQNVAPAGITVTNAALTYTINGGSSINTASILKEGNGRLLLDNNGINNFPKGVVLSAGTLQFGNDDGVNPPATGNLIDNGTMIFDCGNSPTVTNLISGAGTFVQMGGDAVILSGANIGFTGSVLVGNNSKLELGSAAALGSVHVTTVTNGSTLDLGGFTGYGQVMASGVGVNGNGAIDNSSSVIPPTDLGLTNLTMTGDTTIGTSGDRWDLRSPNGTTGSPAGTSLSTGGHGYNLTKVGSGGTGAGFFSLASVTVDPALGNVNVEAGTFEFNGNTTGLGNSASNLTVSAGAIFQMYSASNQLNKVVVVDDGGTLGNANGANTIIGPVVLTNVDSSPQPYCVFNVGGTSMTLNGPLSGNGILFENTGAAPLNLNGNSPLFAGGIFMNAGSIVLNGTLNVPTGVFLNQGKFAFNGTLLGGITNNPATTVAGSGTNTLSLDASGNVNPGDTNLVGTMTVGGLVVEGSATLNFDLTTTTGVGGGTNDLIVDTGDLTLNGGSINLNPIGLLKTGVPYRLINYAGALNLNALPTVNSLGGYTFTLITSVTNQISLMASGGPPVWNGGSATDSDWSDAANWGGIAIQPNGQLYFDGNTRLNNTNDIAAGTSYADIDFNTTAGAFVLNGNAVGMGGNFNNFSPNPETVLLGANIGLNTNTTFNGIAGPLIIGGGVTNVSGNFSSLTLSGTGVLTNLLGSTSPNGTNTILMTATNANWTLVDNASSTPMTVPWLLGINDGTFTMGNAGSAPNVNSLTVNGAPNDFVVGSVNGAVGRFNMVNGTLTTQARFDTGTATTATGIVNQVGGTLTIGSQFQGANGGATDFSFVTNSGGIMNIGTAAAPTATFFVASRGPGVLTVSGTGEVNCGALDVSRCINSTIPGTVNLNGGVLTVSKVSTATANSTATSTGDTATFNFNGGVLQASASSATFYQGNTASPVCPVTSIVQAGGAIINDGSFAISILEPLQHSTSLGTTPDGGLIKLGAGTLTLAAVSTYTGNTVVSNGTLAVNGSVGMTAVTVATNAALVGTGSLGSNVTVNVGGTLSPGTVGTIGTLTVVSNVTLNGTAAMDINGTTLTGDNLKAGGSITYGGTLSVANLGGTPVGGSTFTLFTAASYNGSFTATNLPALAGGLSWSWNPANGTLSVVQLVNTNPATAEFQATAASGSLQFTWAPDHLGWQLYTNSVGLASANNWFPVPGSASVTNETILINPSNPNVFFQLRYP